MKDPHQLIGRTCRIGQRAEDVKNSAYSHLAANRRDVFHRRMMVGREHEAEASGLNALSHLFGLEIDPCAQRFQHVGAAGFGSVSYTHLDVYKRQNNPSTPLSKS